MKSHQLVLKSNLPTRRLPPQPDLDQLKRQAKELLTAFRAADARAVAEINTHFHNADPAGFALHDAQLVLARSYGFESWPKLKARVDGATANRLVDVIRAGNVAMARAMLKARPELASMTGDNLPILHHAVLARQAEMVRVLIEYGASAREGVYPHRDATSALDIAIERGYDEIAAVITEAERIRGMHRGPEAHRNPLHEACRDLDSARVARLLDRGAAPAPVDDQQRTPFDIAAMQRRGKSVPERFHAIADLLRGKGATLTARAAAALGDTDWLRAHHPENPIEPDGGLLRIAVTHHRPEVLRLMLDLGYDPDERTRIGNSDEIEFSWGMPLWHCAGAGEYQMATLLLNAKADANGRVYASGSPLFQAFSQADTKMIGLLRQYGGEPEATSAGLFRQTELAGKMLAGEAAYRLDGVGGDTLAEQLLWGAACGGDPEIVRMALERVDWPRDDPRWFTILEQPLRIWRYGIEQNSWDRTTYPTCFKLALDRCDANISGRFGLSLLHSVAGSREHVTAEERVAFAKMLLDAGAGLDTRDGLLGKTPLEWARRWKRPELVDLLSR